MVVSVLGGAIGIAIGSGLAALISQVQVPGSGGAPSNLQTQVGLDSVMLAFFVSAAIGLFFGIYPADALRASTRSKRCGTSSLCPPS